MSNGRSFRKSPRFTLDAGKSWCDHTFLEMLMKIGVSKVNERLVRLRKGVGGL